MSFSSKSKKEEDIKKQKKKFWKCTDIWKNLYADLNISFVIEADSGEGLSAAVKDKIKLN